MVKRLCSTAQRMFSVKFQGILIISIKHVNDTNVKVCKIESTYSCLVAMVRENGQHNNIEQCKKRYDVDRRITILQNVQLSVTAV